MEYPALVRGRFGVSFVVGVLATAACGGAGGEQTAADDGGSASGQSGADGGDRADAESVDGSFADAAGGADRPPVARADAYSVAEDRLLEVAATTGVLGNDEDADGDRIEAVIVEPPAHGSLSLRADGSFTYAPDGDYFGDDDFAYRASSAIAESDPTTVAIDVRPVNDAPSFVGGGNQVVTEDDGPQSVPGWASAMVPGPANEAGQAVALLVGNDAPALFSAEPALSAAGELTFTPAPDAFGIATVTVTLSDDGGVDDGGADTSIEVVFTIAIAGLNDEPSFTKGSNKTVFEDAPTQTFAGWATAISAGPGEASQGLSFELQTDNDALFASGPSVATNGTLSFELAPDAHGVANVTVTLSDDGGTAGGGDDTGPPQTFSITVTAVNDAPSFEGSDILTLEDSGAQSLTGWASGYTPGPTNETTQGYLGFSVMHDAPGMFASGGEPVVALDGTLSFELAPDAVGTVTLEVSLRDDGGAGNGGVDVGTQSYTLSVTPVNDEPSLVLGSTPSADEDAPTQVLTGWATLSAGPADEVASQVLLLSVQAADTTLFAVQPSIDAAGTLRFRPAPNAYGTTDVSVMLSDDGGIALGGDDTAPSQQFSITVTAVNDDPSAVDDDVTTPEDVGIVIDVVSNDSDVDGDTPVLSAVGAAGLGNASILSGRIVYVPSWRSTGIDSFSYTIVDGQGGSAIGTVTVTIEPDTTPPGIVSTTPIDGDVLSLAEAYAPGNQLFPAAFQFDDPLLDGAAVVVNVSWKGIPLVEDVDFTVEPTEPGRIEIVVDELAVTPTGSTGDLLVFALTGIEDTHGFAGSDVTVSVVFDADPPSATKLDFFNDTFTRCVLQWSEPMSTASSATFAFEDDTLGVPVLVEPDDGAYRGSGWASIMQEDDFFFFVPRDPIPEGHTIHYDASGFTDLAGNPGQGAVVSNIDLFQGTSVGIAEIRFVPVGTTGPAVAVVLPADIVADAFLVPNTVDGTDYDMLVLLESGLDAGPPAAEMHDETTFFGSNVVGSFETTNEPNDTVRFAPTGVDAAFTWDGGERFDFDVEGYDSSLFGYARIALDFLVQKTGTDGVAPSVVTVGERATATDGADVLLRPGEPLELWFSEQVDMTTLVPASFSLVGVVSGAVPLVLTRVGDGPFQSLLLRPDDGTGGPGRFAPDSYALAIDGVTDASDPPETTSLSIEFEVAPWSAAAPAFVESSPSDGDALLPTDVSVIVGFDDAIWLPSMRDVGDPALRGFRFEERFAGAAGAVWVPRKGLGPPEGEVDQRHPAIVPLDFRGGGGLRESTSYRFTTGPGLVNGDGTPLASPATFVFDTAAAAEPSGHRPAFQWIAAQVETREPIVFQGTLEETEARLSVYGTDPDGGDWTIVWQNVTASTLETFGTFAFPSAENVLVGTAAEAFLDPGDNETVVTLRDATDLEAALGQTVYAFDPAVLAAAAPTVTDLGGGRYAFGGSVPASVGPRVLRAYLFVGIIDTTGSPPPYVVTGLAYMTTAQLTRAPAGSLTYLHTMPADTSLPHLIGAQEYRTVVSLMVEDERGFPGDDSTGTSPVSPPFNPPP